MMVYFLLLVDLIWIVPSDKQLGDPPSLPLEQAGNGV
jgi:hypothetical protein